MPRPNPSVPESSGTFISLDGLDGTGKSTQCRLLAQWLQSHGHSVTLCVDPGGTPLGSVIRQILLDQRQTMSVVSEMFLFMASRAELVEEMIRPALHKGQVVVSDRFLLANVVYQGHAGGLDPQQVWDIGLVATGGLVPALTLVLDLPVAAALARKVGPPDRLESRAGDFHERVRQGFLTEARRQPERISVIDAGRPLEQVHAAILEEVQRVLGQHPRP